MPFGFAGIRITIAFLACLVCSSAALAGGIDGHGPIPPANTEDAAAPLRSWTPVVQDKAFRTSLLLEFALGSVVQQTYSPTNAADSSTYKKVWLDNLFGANLNVSWAPHERVGLSATAPLWFYMLSAEGAAAMTMGDGEFAVPIGLLLPKNKLQFGLSAVPFFRFPTGSSNRWVGDGKVGGGLILAAGLHHGVFAATGNLGIDLRQRQAFEGPGDVMLGGPAIRAAGSVGWVPRERFGIHLESTYAYNVMLDNTSYNPETQREERHRSTPLELSVTTRARPKDHWWLALGLGGGIGPDTIGQSSFRLQAGMGFSFKPGQPIAPEVVEEVFFTFVVVDQQGEPIEGAAFSRGSNLLGESDAAGELRLPAPVRFGSGISVDHHSYLSEKLERPPEDQPSVEVTLLWQPVGLTVSVRDKVGEVLPATVEIEGPTDLPEVVAQEDGTLRGALLPGDWTLLISAEGYGEQVRHVNVPPRSTADVKVESILIEEQGAAELALSFVDSEGTPIEGVRILLDGIPLGSAKALGLDSLASGVHELSISAHGYRPVEQKLDLGDVKTVLDIRMRDADGALKVKVVDADGVAVPDAHVGFLKGTERYPPVGLGDSGERRFQLTPGEWKVLVTSSVFGMQERDVVLKENAAVVEVVEIRFQPEEGGEAQLVVIVRDTDNNPLEGAEVFLDDKPLGKTGSGGSLVVHALEVGPRLIRVEGEHFRPMEPLEKFVVVGPNLANVSLEWKTGTCQVAVTGPDGPVDDVVVRAYGPQPAPPVELGVSGTGIIKLSPGEWEVLFSSASLGMHTRPLMVPEESPSLIELDVVLMPHGDEDMSELALEVLGPRGKPVDGAVVYVDGTSRGKTAGGGKLNVPWLPPGQREVTIDAPLYGVAAHVVTLAEGKQPLQVNLDWDVGVVEVQARTPTEPITDGFVRFLSLTRTIPAMPLGRDGKQLAKLVPGKWQVLVTSAQYGILTKEVEVVETPGLMEVTLETEAFVPESAELLVRIVDVHERPIQDAVVQLGDAEVLAASLAGTRHILGLQRGRATINVSAKGYRPVEMPVELRESWQELRVVLESIGVPVRVVVTDSSGQAVPAILRFEGPFHLPVARLDDTGQKELSVRPGKWRIIAEAKGLEVLTYDFEVASSDADLVVELRLKESKVDITHEEVVIHGEIFFDTDKAVVTDESNDILDEVANNLLAHRAILVMEIQGHTDSVGDVAYNQALSERRAEAVKVALVARGVGPERLVARGYGPVRPLADNDTDEGRQRNRRVQFDIMEWNTLAAPMEEEQ